MARKQNWQRSAARLTALAVGTAAALVVVSPASPAAAGRAGGGLWRYDTTVTQMTQARNQAGVDLSSATGRGVGVALIDTGVTQVAGLNQGQVVNGIDLSFESQDPAKRYLDSNGHGTHLAGIIVGRPTSTSDVNFKGIAPDAKLTSIKVGIRNGAVDVVQVLAAIDWVVAHRNDDPANPIKVINLAYGTSGTQDYKVDPLAHAVENAWKAGIVVVVAGGNDGTSGKLVNPAYDPYVLTVGALDGNNTTELLDDKVASFTTRGNSTRSIDLVAPGRSIASLRVPGSEIDVNYPSARVGTNLFKGSGSSQASAMVSGGVALLLQNRPTLNPDQVKSLLKSAATASDLELGGSKRKLGVSQSSSLVTPSTSASAQTFTRSTGRGKVELARGGVHLLDGTNQLLGEKDIFGNTLDVNAWAAASSAKTAWSGGTWMGRDFAGTGWTTVNGTKSWSGRAWSGRAWSGRAWSSTVWSSVAWLGFGWV